MNPHRKLWIYLQAQENIQREASWRPKPPPLALSNVKERCLHSELLSLSLKLSRVTVRTKLILAACICCSYFLSVLWTHSHRWRLEQNLIGKSRSSYGSAPSQYNVFIFADTAPIHLSISCSFLASFVNNTPRHMDSFAHVHARGSSPPQHGAMNRA